MKTNKKNIYIISGVIIVACISAAIFYFGFYKDMKIKEQIKIAFVEGAEMIEYGSVADSKSFVASVEGEIKEYPTIDTKKLGDQTITYVVEKEGVSKVVEYKVNVVDSIVPVVTFTQESVELELNSEFDAKSYIQSVKDFVDGDIPYKETEDKKSNYTIKSDVDTTKVGTYFVDVEAYDVNGNKGEGLLKVEVVEKKVNYDPPNQDPANQGPSNIEPTYINGILLVNKQYGIPRGFGGYNETASNALYQLQAGANSAGFDMPLLSGYRSYDYQVGLYNNYVARDGQAAADRYSARPGYSEHQTGLCFDIGDIDNDYGETAAGRWLASHAHEYGFIIRFPNGKEDITGYMYEPWHVRYVGTQVASDIYAQGVTLEEYLGIR